MAIIVGPEAAKLTTAVLPLDPNERDLRVLRRIPGGATADKLGTSSAFTKVKVFS
jgi:hypothetical protein